MNEASVMIFVKTPVGEYDKCFRIPVPAPDESDELTEDLVAAYLRAYVKPIAGLIVQARGSQRQVKGQAPLFAGPEPAPRPAKPRAKRGVQCT